MALEKAIQRALGEGGPYYDPQTMEPVLDLRNRIEDKALLKKTVEAMAHIQRGLENCYDDIRVAANLETRGLSTMGILTRVEHTLADVLTILNNYSSK